jgi:hypothetical protein
MFLNRKRNLLSGRRTTGLTVAILFLVCASFSAVLNAASRTIEGLEFDSVVVFGSAELQIIQEDTTVLRAKGSNKDLDREPFYVKGDTLYLGSSRKHGHDFGSLLFKLSVPNLKEITLKGSGEIYVKPLQVDELDVELAGSGDINLFKVETGVLNVALAGSGGVRLAEVIAHEVELVVAGSGTIDLGEIQTEILRAIINGSGDINGAKKGQAREVTIEVVGSGDVELEQVRAEVVDVNIMGSGDVIIWADKELDISVMGSGDVSYHGDPEISTTVLGSGDVEELD